MIDERTILEVMDFLYKGFDEKEYFTVSHPDLWRDGDDWAEDGPTERERPGNPRTRGDSHFPRIRDPTAGLLIQPIANPTRQTASKRETGRREMIRFVFVFQLLITAAGWWCLHTGYADGILFLILVCVVNRLRAD